MLMSLNFIHCADTGPIFIKNFRHVLNQANHLPNNDDNGFKWDGSRLSRNRYASNKVYSHSIFTLEPAPCHRSDAFSFIQPKKKMQYNHFRASWLKKHDFGGGIGAVIIMNNAEIASRRTSFLL
jgi:hypothetical protein